MQKSVLRIAIIGAGVLMAFIGCAERGGQRGDNIAREVSLTNLPPIEAFKPDPYIIAAEHFQKIERNAALEELRALAHSCDFSRRCELAVLCRMLFTNRPNAIFERMVGLGGPIFLSDVGPLDSWTNGAPGFKIWTLEPIEIVSGVPFAVVHGYTYQGYWDPSGPAKYVEYCIRECDWSKVQYSGKSTEEKVRAVKKLLALPKWPRRPDERVRDMIREQIQ